MDKFLKNSRQEFIESLEFFYFLDEVFLPLANKHGKQYRKNTNSLIINFFNITDGFYSWQDKKVDSYRQALIDAVFWESREFYRETMVKFVVGELNTLEFVQEFSNHLSTDREKSNNLLKDFKKQLNIEFDPKSFQFSNIILSFELPLEVYQNEVDEFNIKDQVFENDFFFTGDSVTESSLRKGVKKILKEVNKYFTV